MLDQKEMLQNLREKITDFVYPLTLENVFLEKKYNELLMLLIDLTKQMKDESYIIKGVLIELRLTISSMENFQLEFDEVKIQDKTSILEEIFCCLYSGEVYGSRIPGVPRIV